MTQRYTLIFFLFYLAFTNQAYAQRGSKTASAETISPVLYESLNYRMIGPFRGGRCTAVTGVPDEPLTFFMGTTGGGVWKTEDGGIQWQNISDGFIPVGSIGSIEIAPTDANIIYVGTGSASPRGNVSPGKGMYKSTDGGLSWKPAGLAKAGQIGKIQIHPKNPELVYAAALGNVFGPSPERGVFRSEDGGQNWEKVLYVNDSTGVIDLVMDPKNPRILYAGAWQVERKPWTIIDGGKGGGVYKSTDGGDSWEKLSGGLPEGVVGRVGIAVSPLNSRRVWVIQEALDEEKGGLYMSEDGGKSWQRINRKHEYRQRAWYYSRIFADPKNEHTLYLLNTDFYKSLNDGKNFERIPVPHGDNHGLWLNPHDPDIMIQSNDGGSNISFNGGKSWSTQNNQPTSEIYRVTVDNQFPYRVYGAQQDNTTISVPSQGLGNLDPLQDWLSVGGGESGHIAVHPENPNIIYAGNYIGVMTRLDRSQGHIRSVEVYPDLNDGIEPYKLKYRFQWNAPIFISRHNPEVIYFASNYVHKSTNEGQNWQVISPDLTTNNQKYLAEIPGGPIQNDNTGVELYCTIFALEESPLQEGLLWAGSDDGLIHISQDGGAKWTNITPPDMPLEGTVNSIDPSPHQAGKATVAVYKYRDNDFHPYIFQTEDYGKSWKKITQGIPKDHFVRVVREDPEQEGLLFAGTEFGMFISFNNGKNWQDFQLNLPRTPITDLKLHQQDLVVATQGRSFWIMDGIAPLRQLSAQTSLAEPLLFKPDVAYRTQVDGYRGKNTPENKARGAVIHYYLPAEQDSISLEILDHKGKVVRNFNSVEHSAQLKSSKGSHRFVWNLTYPEPDLIEGAIMSLSYTGGPKATPGDYTIRLHSGEKVLEQTLRLEKDPRWQYTDEELEAQFDLAVAVRDSLTAVHELIRSIRGLKEQATYITERSQKAAYADKLRQPCQRLVEKLDALEEELIQTRSESSQDPINYPVRLDNQFSYLYTVVHEQDARPTEGCYTRFEDLKQEVAEKRKVYQQILDNELREFEKIIREQGVPRLIISSLR
ncbi:MAG: glycosyl hydrolase [Cyclobacteriaceae bacterium]